MRAALLLAASTVLVGVTACSGSGGDPATGSSPAPTDFSEITTGKEWTVDASGWWVPEDPTGCGQETTTCHINLWPTRAYKGSSVPNAVVHGQKITLYCKAPTPAVIRSAVKTQAEYWYYSDVDGKRMWVPDIYVTKDNLTGMAEGVPDCPSNTPGING